MNRSDAEKLSNDLSKHLIDAIKEHGQIGMSVHVVCRDKIRALKKFDTADGSQKAVVAEMARYLSRKYQADCVVLSAESFVIASEASPEEQREIREYGKKHGTIEGHPLTRDAVFMMIEMRDSTVLRCYPFSRNKDGSVDKIEDSIQFPDGEKLDGVLANMMNPAKKLNIPDSVLEEMERVCVEVIAAKNMGIQRANDSGHTLH